MGVVDFNFSVPSLELCEISLLRAVKANKLQRGAPLWLRQRSGSAPASRPGAPVEHRQRLETRAHQPQKSCNAAPATKIIHGRASPKPTNYSMELPYGSDSVPAALRHRDPMLRLSAGSVLKRGRACLELDVAKISQRYRAGRELAAQR